MQESELIKILSRDLFKVINRAHTDIINGTYPNGERIVEALTLASADEIAGTRTMFAIYPPSMSTFSIKNIGDCDIFYALLTDDFVKKIINSRVTAGTSSRDWWPKHSITKRVQLECAISEASDLLKDPILDCKDSFAKAIANSALKLRKKFLLPRCKDSLSISPNVIKMLNRNLQELWPADDQQLNKHLPGEVQFYSLHSTPIPKKRTLEIRPKLSNSTVLNIEMKHLPSHPLANLQQQPDGRHPLQTRPPQQEIMERKPKYKVPNDDSIQRQNWYSYQNRVLDLDSGPGRTERRRPARIEG